MIQVTDFHLECKYIYSEAGVANYEFREIRAKWSYLSSATVIGALQMRHLSTLSPTVSNEDVGTSSPCQYFMIIFKEMPLSLFLRVLSTSSTGVTLYPTIRVCRRNPEQQRQVLNRRLFCSLMPPKATMSLRPSILPYSSPSIRVNWRNLLEPDFQG